MDERQAIKDKVAVVELISETVPLKKAGRNFKGVCPFHNEKTPSFVVSPERQIWHCFGCFPPGEYVKTPFGHHAIETLDTNHWVISGVGKSRKIERVLEREYDGELIELVTRKLRYKTRLTSDHSVFTLGGAPYTKKQYKNFSRRYKTYLKLKQKDTQAYFKKTEQYFPIKQVSAGELNSEDVLLYPISRIERDIDKLDLSFYLSKYTNFGPVPKQLSKISITDDFLRLIGYYIAEGSNHRAYIRFSLGNDELSFAKEIKKIISKLFSIKASIHTRTEKKSGIEVTACHAKLANIFENLCGKGAAFKHIPFIFQELPQQKQKILLEAIWKGDGTSFRANKSKNRHRSITSVSRVLIEQLVDILLRLHFFPSVHISQSKIDKNNVTHKIAFSVFWSEEAEQKYGDIYYTREGYEYWILPINRIKKTHYQGLVYNLTVNQDHSYVASHFAVANCGKGGDIFTFLMELDRIEFPEALKILAHRAGVEINSFPQQNKNQEIREKIISIHALAEEFYQYLLTKHAIGQRARLYLKNRGVSEEIAKTFGLGFAPNSWENTYKFLRKKGYSDSILELSGLVLKGRNGMYDRFRGRIMFPIKNYRGQTIAFSGRVLESSTKDAKYINSPQTPIYTKGDTLYGISVTKESIRKEGLAIIVEGEFDVISSYASGITNVVAIKGSALTESQVHLIKRFTEQIILSLDQDAAGDAASRRGIEIAQRVGLHIKIVGKLDGKDPDEVARSSPHVWKKAIREATPYYDFLLNSALSRYNVTEAFGKKKISDELLPIISRIENSIIQSHYIKLLAKKLDVAEVKINEAMQKKPRPVSEKIQTVSFGKKSTLSHEELTEEHLLAMILQSVPLKKALDEVCTTLDPSDMVHPLVSKIIMELIDVVDNEEITITQLAKVMPAELLPTFDRLYITEVINFSDTNQQRKELHKTITVVKRNILRRKIAEISQKMAKMQEKEDADEFKKLQIDLSQNMQELKYLEEAVTDGSKLV